MKIKHILPILLTSVLTFSQFGCGDDDLDDLVSEEDSYAEDSESGSQPGNGDSGSQGDTVLISDPVENAFTVKMPKGWTNRAYTARLADVNRTIITSISPNTETMMYKGDPSIPIYWNPNKISKEMKMIADMTPLIEVEPYQEADTYFEAYTRRKFGKLDDFQITSVVQDEALREENHKIAYKFQNRDWPVSAANIHFNYTDNGKKMSAMVIGVSCDFDKFWMLEVLGISTTGNPNDHREMCLNISRSVTFNPEWQAEQNRLDEERKQEMIRGHNERMNNIQLSGQRHQARMRKIWAAGDASMQRYYQRSAASDANHRNFLNYVNDESTVLDSSGKTHQVDNSYERYYMHKRNGTYVGGDTHFNEDALRRSGVNPDDYEEVQIKK